ncbi:polysaccharide biosynthesis protein [Methanofollis aquaemaris]|uniref:Polysaccharide biosynthesis protein n=1 Tax=Methanofollis aquaemaris TaxID=126734 RepID=A0A8A3S6G9_9EURY|nr:oligosaccharide flippase family protein [Methanofollis aquaemaris]QSZ67331.1 polysaccharide biosynthesis protein [Methanofollis aquaemaris]
MEDQDHVEVNRSFVGQFPLNLISNILLFIVNVVTGFWLTPFFISTLGIAAYGLIPLAITVTTYLGLATRSLNFTVARYLTVDLQRQEYTRANLTFNTAFFGIVGLAVFLVFPLVFLLAFNVDAVFNVPSGELTDVIYLFLGIHISFLIRTVGSTFSVSFFAHNRLDLYNIVEAFGRILEVGLIVALFLWAAPRLGYVGVAYLVTSFFLLFLMIGAWRVLTPQLSVRLRSFNRSSLKEMSVFGSWMLVNEIGSLLFLQVDLIIVNIFLGPFAGGEYAVALTWSILLRTMGGVLAGVIAPMIFIYYAREMFAEIKRMAISSVKCMGLALALPVGLICGFGSELLTLWVGAEHAGLAPLLVLLVIPLGVNLAVLPLNHVAVSYSKVKIPGIATIVLGAANVLLALWLVVGAGWGVFGVAAAGAILFTVKSSIFMPWYSAKVLSIPVRAFFKPLVAVAFATLAIALVSLVLGGLVPIESWLELGVISGAIGILYLLFVWCCLFTEEERVIFGSLLPAQIRKFLVPSTGVDGSSPLEKY